MAEAGMELPEWYRDMEKDLECPVCLNSILDPPVYVCENQHDLCSTCHEKLTNRMKPCPLCKGHLTNKRHLFLERMLEKLPRTKCVFPECSFKRAEMQAVLDHQEDCIHRKIPCIFCGEGVALSKLNSHLENEYGLEAPTDYYNQKVVWELGWDMIGQTVMLAPPPAFTNEMFFYFNRMHLDENTLILWVSYNGSKKDARKYQYTVEILEPNRRQIALSCTKFCVPCDFSFDVVKEKFLGVAITKDLAVDVTTPWQKNFWAKVRFFHRR